VKIENRRGSDAKQEGLGAIPSGKFKNSDAFFQIAMLAYNHWRSFKLLANLRYGKIRTLARIADNKIRITRLKLPMISAKVVKSGNRDMVRYSIHDKRTPALLLFYEFPDHLRFKKTSGVQGMNTLTDLMHELSCTESVLNSGGG
jgi:hypothetical protein